MKTRKLHVKIFLTTILILILSELTVFVLFRNTALKFIYETAYDYLSYRAGGVKSLFEERIKNGVTGTSDSPESLSRLVSDMKRLYSTDICLVTPAGSVIGFAAMDETVPVIPFNQLIFHKNYYYKNIVTPESNRFYIRLPLQFPNGKDGSAIFQLDRAKFRFVSAAEDLIVLLFFLYLAGIVIGVAIIMFPASRFITRPLRNLQNSARRIGNGDLSHRADINTSDEIGNLGSSFNQMADTFELMIRGNRELSSNISHELRSPLARIRIAQEIIRDKLENPDRKLSPTIELDAIQIEIEEMDRLISQILLLSKLDTLSVFRARESLDIVKETEAIVNRFTKAIEHKQLRFEIIVPFHPVATLANSEDIRIVITNLLDNAIKYTPADGHIKFTIDTAEDRIVLAVYNTCVIPNIGDINRIFEPFFRLSPQEGSGSGLGLAITKKIIGNYKGSIGVSTKENGILFEVILPCQADFKGI